MALSAFLALCLALQQPAAPAPRADEIWVASWKTVPVGLDFVTPMIWLDGYYKPGQDNPSIDPDALARRAKAAPPGRRMIFWYRYSLSFWGARADSAALADGALAPLPWPTTTAPAIESEWTRFLDLFKYCGGEIDYLIGDCEDWTRFLSWGLSPEQFRAIVADHRFDQECLGVPLLRQLSAGVPLDSVLQPQRSDAYLRWNLQVGRFASGVMNETLWKPALARFPALQGSNYDGKVMLDRPAPDLNGHAQPSDNIFGNRSSPVAYGTVAQAATSWFIDPADPTRLARAGKDRLGRGPWQSFLMDVQLGRACRRGTPDRALTPWIAPFTYPGDQRGTVGYPDDTRCWDEMIRHYALLGTSVFLWWNPESVPVPGGKVIQIPELASQPRRIDALMREVNARLGGPVAATVDASPIPFSSDLVLTGARTRAGKYVWRATVRPGIGMVRDADSGATIAVEEGTLGAWIETAVATPPRLQAVN